MKTLRFYFPCHRPVPFYHSYFNQLLATAELDLAIGYHNASGQTHYLLDASGSQAQLEQLADLLARELPVSLALGKPGLELIETPDSLTAALPIPLIEDEGENVGFCSHCLPWFSQVQEDLPRQLSLSCPCCHGEQQLTPGAQAITADELATAVAVLADGKSAVLGGVTYAYRAAPPNVDGPNLLICDPKVLTKHLLADAEQQLALSALEKPWVRLTPLPGHELLNLHWYRCRFAASRLELLLTAALARAGMDWVHVSQDGARDEVCQLAGTWMPVQRSQSFKLTLSESLIAQTESDTGAWRARSCGPEQLLLEPLTHGAEIKDASRLALQGTLLTRGKALANSAVLYLGHQGPMQLQGYDAQAEQQVFLSLSPLPATGLQLYQALLSGAPELIQKFREQFPYECLALSELNLSNGTSPRTDSLQSLLATAACVLGLGYRQSKQQLAAALAASASHHRGHNAPRVDFPLVWGSEGRTIDWRRMLGTLISFRLAGDKDSCRLAFGVLDSLADYLANWVEHLDQQLGIEQLVLAGQDLNNPVLAQRLTLRLGKNVRLRVNPALDLDGSLLAVGALFDRPARRLGQQRESAP
ncbi:hypothetical protein JYB88_09300 [Shewanella cyperi]|uniref:Carbamoyltransferase Kae1-like domain-containing protein n=1 Tax=Shewanella cyperi TaxID=2814292 RepID=A0A974XHK6_9GAMM|nr:hypothetical protein [Shewanella cyperi]QSX28504.1 hypothetical protein JYB88_09300 [Shewanella cyperi]